MTRKELNDLITLQPKKPVVRSDYLSTGSTLLNLACTGLPYGGFIKGKYFYFVGDSNSGKTFLTLTCFAEAAKNPNFDGYDFIFDDVEDGALMDIEKFFGKKVKNRLQPPSTIKGVPYYSRTIQDFYYHLDQARVRGKPFIYVLDSMDALSSKEEQKKVQESNKAHHKLLTEGKEKKLAGSYGDGKAKENSTKLRASIDFLKSSGSILIIISQTRDNLTPMSLEKKTRSGGKALTFYATLELWTAQAGHLKKKIGDRNIEQGIYSKIRIKKNRLSGKDRAVTIPIYHSYGIDDVGSCVDYLTGVGFWKKGSGRVVAPELDFSGRTDELIEYIEEFEFETQVQSLVKKAWDREEELAKISRKPRYE